MSSFERLSRLIRNCLIIFCCLQFRIIETEAQWKTFEFLSKYKYSRKSGLYHFDSPNLVYALCKDTQPSDSEQRCMIIQHKDVHNVTAKHIQCEFSLKNASEGLLSIRNFGDDRAIFAWADEETIESRITKHHYRTAVMNMQSCKYRHTKLVLSAGSPNHPYRYSSQHWYNYHTNTIVYEDTFDLVVQKVKACGSALEEDHCVYTYDIDGKRVGEPITQYSPKREKEHYQFHSCIHPDSSDKSYLVSTELSKRLQVLLVKPIATPNKKAVIKLLWEPTRSFDSRPAFLCNDGMIGICSCDVITKRNKLMCNCFQYDENSKTKRRMELTLKTPDGAIPYVIHMHNLRSGGFFIVPVYVISDQYSYSIFQVSSDGAVVGEPVVLNHERTCDVKFDEKHFIEEKDGQYCINLSCIRHIHSGTTLKTLTKCYTPSSLGWKIHTKERIEL